MKQKKKEPKKLKLLVSYYKPYKGLFFADLFFAFLGAAVTLVIPLLVRYIMNTVGEMPTQEAKAIILKIGVGMLALILVQLGSRYFITYYGHMMGTYIEHDMRNEIFSHYQKLSFAFYDNQKVGHLLSRITSDLFDISELSIMEPENILISVIKLFGALIILMNVKPEMALILFRRGCGDADLCPGIQPENEERIQGEPSCVSERSTARLRTAWQVSVW